ncbi:hypothetical protein, partial [uncultured Fibrobacter sp.]|uniref:hypothetical protein n=1 Tax=uncultured Fibrobacter sp. TaxID=261512 RepID=UPI0025FCB82B
DVEIMIKFLEKNQEIINHPKELREIEYKGTDIQMTESAPRYEEIVQQLRTTSLEDIPKFVEKLYNDGKYFPAEIKKALEIWRKGG